jgi:arylamine N-acetyltransferase
MPFNQYQNVNVQLESSTTYNVELLLTFTPVAGATYWPQTQPTFIVDLSSLTYYVDVPASASALSAAPVALSAFSAARSSAPVARSSAPAARSSAPVARSSAQQPVGRVAPSVVRVSPSVQQPASGPGQRVLRYNM